MPDSDAPRRPPGPGSTGDPARRSDAWAPPRPGDSGLRAFFDCVPATVWTTDRHLALTFIDGLLLRRLDITPARLLGRTLPDLLLDGREDHPLVQGHLAAIAGHETTVRIEWGGDAYSVRLAPLRDPAGEIIGAVGVQQVVGWVPDNEGTLREADVRLRRAIDENFVGIAFGNEDGQITDANDAFLELAGYAREDLTADDVSWPVLVPVERHQRHLDAIDQVKRTGRCTPFETELIRKDGRRIPVIVGGARLSARRREGVAFVLDLSVSTHARRHVGAELAAADRLLDAARPDEAVAGVLGVLCTDLPWQGAALWRRTGGGPPRLVGRHGTVDIADAVLDETARHAVTMPEPQWSASRGMLVLPLSTEAGGETALLLVDRPGPAPDAGIISTSKAIGVRLLRFLARR